MNAGVEVRPARSDQEARQAFQLAYQVFSERMPGGANEPFKSLIWFEDPEYRVENIICLFTESKEVVGVLRLVPRRFKRDLELFDAVGFSSICIHPDFRKKGLSVLLISGALDVAIERNFDFAFLTARKALDYYYLRFGFIGIDTYENLQFSESRDPGPAWSISPMSLQYRSLYSSVYEESYSDCFGKMLRGEHHWSHIVGLLKQRADLTGLTLHFEGEASGYAVLQGYQIVELAIRSLGLAEVQGLLDREIPEFKSRETIHIPVRHRIVDSAVSGDLRLMRRGCPYGGQMIRLLKASRFGASVCARESEATPGELIVEKVRLTAQALQVWTPAFESAYSFTIGVLDEA